MSLSGRCHLRTLNPWGVGLDGADRQKHSESAWKYQFGGQDSHRRNLSYTVHASDRAKYVLFVEGARKDSVFINQNIGNGTWVPLMTVDLPGRCDVSLTVSDAMSPVLANRVLRADAIQFQ